MEIFLDCNSQQQYYTENEDKRVLKTPRKVLMLMDGSRSKFVQEYINFDFQKQIWVQYGVLDPTQSPIYAV